MSSQDVRLDSLINSVGYTVNRLVRPNDQNGAPENLRRTHNLYFLKTNRHPCHSKSTATVIATARKQQRAHS